MCARAVASPEISEKAFDEGMRPQVGGNTKVTVYLCLLADAFAYMREEAIMNKPLSACCAFDFHNRGFASCLSLFHVPQLMSEF